jgi:Fe-S-cluster containining protein
MFPKNRKKCQIYTRKTHFYKNFPFSVKKTTEFVRKKPLTIPLNRHMLQSPYFTKRKKENKKEKKWGIDFRIANYG